MTAPLIIEENGLEVPEYVIGVLLYLALVNYYYTLLELSSRLVYYQNSL